MPPSHLSQSAKPLSGRYLSFEEREEIALLRAQGRGIRHIACPLERAPSTISREVRRNAATLGDSVLVGAGTVLSADAARKVAEAGARLVVMPHSDVEVISAGKASGCYVLPGVATPTEAFAALGAGADGLKMFPADALPPRVLKGWRAVLPKDTPLLPVGGITPETMPGYWAAGAQGFGLGSALYHAGKSLGDIRKSAKAFVRAMTTLKGG